MPYTPEATVQAAQQAERGAQTSVIRSLAATVPPPAEPLEGGLLDLVRQTLETANARLGAGQLPMTFEPIPSGPQPTVPTDIAAATVAFSQAAQAIPQLAGFQFDPVEVLSSNEGLRHLITVLSSMGGDRKVAASLQGPSSPMDTLPTSAAMR